MRTVTRLIDRRTRAQSGFTLIEVLLTIAVVSAVMVPLLAWTVLTLQRSDDQSTSADTTTFTQISRFVTRDVAQASVLEAGEPAPGGGVVEPTDPCGVAEFGDFNAAAPSARTWLVLYSTDGAAVAYVTDRKAGEFRMFRRECATDGTDIGAPLELATKLRELTAADGVATGFQGQPVAVSCEDRVGLDEDCGVVALKLKAQRAAPVNIRAERRIDDPAAALQQPTAIIRCLPSCEGTRGADKSYEVVLDGTRSTWPSADESLLLTEWTFPEELGLGTISDLRTAPLSFACTRDMEAWDSQLANDVGDVIGGCRFRVDLRITDLQFSQSSVRSIFVTVYNSVPRVEVTPSPVVADRVTRVNFDASATIDVDDPDSEELQFEWFFDDPALRPGESNTATGPTVDHQYSTLTGDTPRTATLTVTDNEGVQIVEEISVEVRNLGPVARIVGNFDIESIPNPEPMVFSGDNAAGELSFDPDGNENNDGPARVQRLEWVLVDADGEVLTEVDENGVPVVGPDGNPVGAGSGPTFTLPAGAIKVAGVYTLRLTVWDLEDPNLFDTTQVIIDVNTQPRSAIVSMSPTSGTITPENGETTITIDGGASDGSTGSFDPDDGGFITSYRWEFWTSTGAAPTAPCSSTVAPPCYIDTGATQTVTFGPSEPSNRRVPFGRYKVKLVVFDNNYVPNECSAANPYNPTCVDDRTDLARDANPYVDVFINRVPTFTGVTFSPSSGSPSGVDRRIDTTFSPVGTVSDPDGSVATYQWSFRRLTAPTATPVATEPASPNLAVVSPVLQFIEPEVDYQVRATLRVTDELGGFRERSVDFWVRNRNPVSGITVVNSQTAASPINTPNYPVWTSANPATEPARFRLDAGASTDADGTIQSRYWRVWRVNNAGTRLDAQPIAELSDTNSNGANCTVISGVVTVLSQNCFVWEVELFEWGRYEVDLEVRDNDEFRNNGRGLNRQSTFVRVNRPPRVSVATDVGGVASDTCTTSGIGTACSIGFTPSANDDDNGGTITTYRYSWGDGSPDTVVSSANRVSKTFNRLRPDGTCATNTGQCGQFRVRVTVTNNTLGTAFVDVLVRVNLRPVAQLIDPVTGLPATSEVRVRQNCPPTASDPNIANCTMFPVDGSASSDPDGTIVEYRWYADLFIPVSPSTNLVATSTSPIAPPFPFTTGYPLANGRTFFLVVVDNDGSLSTATSFRVAANRPPRTVLITQPSGPSPVAVQRSVLTTWQGSVQEDVGDTVVFTWRFERSDGTPIQVLNSSGQLVNSVSTAPAPVTSGTVQSPPVQIAIPQSGVGRAILTARDSLGQQLSNSSTFAVDVTDARPVAVVNPVSPTGSNPLVFTDAGDTPAAYSFTVSGANSFDPDGSGPPNFTQGPVTSYSWTVSRTTTPTASSICTGSSATLSCTLPQVFGTYRISLTVTDAVGNVSTATTWDVRVNRPPTAVVSPTSAVNTGAPFTVNFSAAGSQDGRPGFADPGGGIASYRWNWGDGTPDTVVTTPAGNPTQTASKTFTAPGSYVVTLTVTDTNGATSAATSVVKVNRAPSAVITARRNGTPCPSVQGPVGCVLNAPGPYVVALDSLASSDVDGSLTTHAWSVTGPGVNVSRANDIGPFDVTLPGPGVYQVQLQVTDDNGATGTATGVITVNAPPTAVIANGEPLQLQRGASFQFDATGSSDADGSVQSYRWQFFDENGVQIGDTGQVSTQQFGFAIAQLVPLPPATGTGTVRLTVTDNLGGTGIDEADYTVGNQLPVPVVSTDPEPATITPDGVGGRATLTLDGSASSDPDNPGAPLDHEWTITNVATSASFTVDGDVVELGPGTTPALPPGRYDVTLTVTDGDGDTATSPVVRVVVNRAPAAAATADPAVINPGDSSTLQLDGASSTDADGGTIASYAWDISGPNGYSQSRTGVSPSVDLPSVTGTYVVTLSVTDDDGGVDTDVVVVKVNAAPDALVSVSHAGPLCDDAVATPCVVNAPYDVTIDGSGSSDADGSIASYSWTLRGPVPPGDPGGGAVVATSIASSFPASLPSAGIYAVELTVTDGDGAATTTTATLRANDPPTADMGSEDPVVFERGVERVLSAAASVDTDGDGVTSYRWQFLNENGVVILDSGASPDSGFPVSFSALVPASASPVGSTGTVRLVVTDGAGAESVPLERDFVVRNRAPIASLVATPDDAVVGIDTRVTYLSESSDPDGTLVQQQLIRCARDDAAPDGYDPGSCDAPIEVDPVGGAEVDFGEYGSFVVRLVVTDNDGATAEDSIQIKVNRPPVAQIGACPAAPAQCSSSATAGVPTQFDGGPGFSEDLDGTIQGYFWSFEGPAFVEPEFDPSITVTFPQSGTYTVTLFVVDDDNELSEAATATISVQGA